MGCERCIIDGISSRHDNGGVKIVRSNIRVLTAQKGQRERRRISLRTVSEETGISRYTIYAFANDTISEYPKDVVTKLCNYFDCSVGDLLLTEDVAEGV
jgi:putative transcriptional regulator